MSGGASYHDLAALLSKVTDGGGGEVEVPGLEGAEHHRVGDVTGAEGGGGVKERKLPED